MASTMQVVLKQDVENLGHTGDLVKVRPGYARNFLLPRGLAVAATRANVKEIEHERMLAAKKAEKLRLEQQEIAKGLEKVVVMVAKEASEEGKLFGSVTAAEVAEALVTKGIDIDKKKLVMPEELIKEVGSYQVSVKLPYGVTASFKLEVKTKA